jgi:hypothetical protein
LTQHPLIGSSPRDRCADSSVDVTTRSPHIPPCAPGPPRRRPGPMLDGVRVGPLRDLDAVLAGTRGRPSRGLARRGSTSRITSLVASPPRSFELLLDRPHELLERLSPREQPAIVRQRAEGKSRPAPRVCQASGAGGAELRALPLEWHSRRRRAEGRRRGTASGRDRHTRLLRQ